MAPSLFSAVRRWEVEGLQRRGDPESLRASPAEHSVRSAWGSLVSGVFTQGKPRGRAGEGSGPVRPGRCWVGPGHRATGTAEPRRCSPGVRAAAPSRAPGLGVAQPQARTPRPDVGRRQGTRARDQESSRPSRARAWYGLLQTRTDALACPRSGGSAASCSCIASSWRRRRPARPGPGSSRNRPGGGGPTSLHVHPRRQWRRLWGRRPALAASHPVARRVGPWEARPGTWYPAPPPPMVGTPGPPCAGPGGPPNRHRHRRRPRPPAGSSRTPPRGSGCAQHPEPPVNRQTPVWDALSPQSW